MATAYAALVSLLNTLDLIQTHPLHSFSFENKQIESLLEIINFLINFMETGDYNDDRSGAAEALEKRIASAAHAAQDLIDSHVADQIRSGSTLIWKTRVSRFFIRRNDLQETIDDMEFVRRKAMKLRKAQSRSKVEQPTFSSKAAAASSSTSMTMVGFDDVLQQLVDLLVGEDDRRVIPIVGMGGLGKTTLARHAFQHKHVVQHFDVCLWVTISQKYDVELILKELLSGSDRPPSGSVAELGVSLHKRLFGRRYLITLDDMWSSEVWSEIMHYFPQDKDNRSRIIVTTRQSDVAHHLTSSSWCFSLHLLDKDKSWDLFCEKVFGDQKGCPPELKWVGYEIVKKCKGLPLAIVVVGGHLRNSSQTLEYWENVAKDMDSILSSGEDESCMDILALSYSYLPVHLKPCFLYIGSFEEDEIVETMTVIRLWIVEGFLKPSKSHNLEEVAEDYLKDLVDRNLILASKRKLNGKIERCTIHDVVRELCLKIVDKEKFFCIIDKRRVVSKSRKRILVKSAPFVFSEIIMNDVDEDLLEFGCDRINLRYLDFFMPRQQRTSLYISPSISQLWSLQTLIVTSSSLEFEILEAPYEFWEMLQLRHVEIKRILLPGPLPNDCGRLNQTNLQTLMRVRNFRLSDEVCKRISHIKRLSIEYGDPMSLHNLSRSLHNLSRLHQLESLECDFYNGREWREHSGFAPCFTFFFPRSLRFPYSLKELSLSGSHLYWEELSNTAGLLPLLEALHLSYDAVIGSQWDTIEGHFDRLKSLTIYSCRNLVNFNVDSSHFPALANLALEDLFKLHELPPSIGELPSLQHIHLSGCSVSLAMSAMRILVEQEQNYGNYGLQLQVSLYDDKKERVRFLKQMEEEGLHSNNLLLHNRWKIHDRDSVFRLSRRPSIQVISNFGQAGNSPTPSPVHLADASLASSPTQTPSSPPRTLADASNFRQAG